MTDRRSSLHNLAFMAVEAVALVSAHALGVPWLSLLALLVALPVVGVVALVYVIRVHMPEAQRRRQAALDAALAERAALLARRSNGPRALPAGARREAA
jgi:hypothetical protein